MAKTDATDEVLNHLQAAARELEYFRGPILTGHGTFADPAAAAAAMARLSRAIEAAKAAIPEARAEAEAVRDTD